jgi:hypothetical protein
VQKKLSFQQKLAKKYKNFQLGKTPSAMVANIKSFSIYIGKFSMAFAEGGSKKRTKILQKFYRVLCEIE